MYIFLYITVCTCVCNRNINISVPPFPLPSPLSPHQMQYDNQPLELARVVQMCLCREADLCGRQKQLSLSVSGACVRVVQTCLCRDSYMYSVH